MKKRIFATLAICSLFTVVNVLNAQGTEDVFDGEEDIYDEDEQKQIELERKKREEAERKLREEEERRVEETKRAAIKKKELREREAAERRKQELDALREASADSTEYTVDSKVELVVELEGNGWFGGRNHRMTFSGDFDFLLRGRAMAHYDYRLFKYLSVGLLLGIDSTDISIYNRFRQSITARAPQQTTILGGISARWRVTEWYLHSSVFLEPSVLFGHLWQTLINIPSNHWRLSPGIFAGLETVFDSGFATTYRFGVEYPLNFGTPNAIKEGLDPLFLVSLGFAI